MLKAYLDRLLAPPLYFHHGNRNIGKNRTGNTPKSERGEKEKLLAYICSNEAALRENQAAPATYSHQDAPTSS